MNYFEIAKGIVRANVPQPRGIPMRAYKDFEDYLQERFILENPTVLDDDQPDAFDAWYSELRTEETVGYAETYASLRVIEAIEGIKAVNRGKD